MIHIRLAVPEDFDQICALFNESHALHHQALPHFFQDSTYIVYEKNIFDAAFAQKSEVIFIAEEGEKLLGAVHAEIHESKNPAHQGAKVLTKRKFGFVHTLVVAAASREHGIGKELLMKVEDWFKERGIDEIEIEAWSFNERAENFYKKAGYEPLNLRLYKKLS
ncbi:MAG: hypothetical protein A2V81_00460 [Candidatus Abawacabacteria bacterium RBG_16_42_10]|uniref:N-acetyltransferase domain-containing protein n=1 Tax=Candidatus Abawacabacteria bacterium RBG_16_42_10 TaxID=1817814 RepID=A0A1F4XKG0_9BACT|nr:MAG: hypothetical protein A2V81_00460 [Candidatus Abawacabacteria bacterium RBG_16_42_10]